MNKMKGINKYHLQVSKDDIANNVHRERVGGMWDELGSLQYEFLLDQGLKPSSKLLDIGCGCLRGGLYFIKYLHKNNYCGLDINSSLLEAGKHEVEKSGLTTKTPLLICSDSFEIYKFNINFDFMISVSVFTHLPMNLIIRCLKNVKYSLAPDGQYFSTFFQSPEVAFIESYRHQPGRVITNYDSDPYHYAIEELNFMARITGLKMRLVGDWGHPRNQKMVVFTHSKV